MKKISIVLLMLVFFSCGNKVDIEGFNEEAWAHDKNGCEGIRKSMKEKLIEIKDQLKSLNTDEVIDLLGRPDKTRLGERSQRYFIYSITPSEKCESYSSSNKSTLSIRFNAMGLAYEVLVL